MPPDEIRSFDGIWYTTRHRACQYGVGGEDCCLQISLLGVEYFIVNTRKGDLFKVSTLQNCVGLFVTTDLPNVQVPCIVG